MFEDCEQVADITSGRALTAHRIGGCVSSAVVQNRIVWFNGGKVPLGPLTQLITCESGAHASYWGDNT